MQIRPKNTQPNIGFYKHQNYDQTYTGENKKKLVSGVPKRICSKKNSTIRF